MISGLRHKGTTVLRALMWAVTSLWPQKEVYRSEIYSARAKLTMISDQARDLVRGTQRQFSENICSEDDL